MGQFALGHRQFPRLFGALALAILIAVAGCGTAQKAPKADGNKLPPRVMEDLGRGVVAVNQGDGKVYVGWRLFGTDPEEISFNLYRAYGKDKPAKVNKTPITATTDYVDSGVKLDQAVSYFVKPVLKGKELAASKPYTLKANAHVQQYIEIPLQTPDRYSPGDCSVGDLDGDGEYEIIVHMTGVGRDSAQAGYTSNPILQAYKLDGTLMWTINLGMNIREGAHYTQFMVYDFDSDGKAEMICKTADGTVDGEGNVIGDPNKDWADLAGRIESGPEYLTVFDGKTGKALATANYEPPRGDVCSWGDCYGNRCDRFLACVAYLDGVRPSVVMCHGYYERTTLAAWNWRDGKLTHLWTFDSDDGTPGNRAYRGQGFHNLSVGDVDQDGKDEIVYGSCTIDDNGKGLYSTGLNHGDAMHMTDLDPSRPGLEVWECHEPSGRYSGGSLTDAKTGEVIWGIPAIGDTGRAMAADIDPRHPGCEVWTVATQGVYDVNGVGITGNTPSVNFAVWWDGDLLRELLDRNSVRKWDYINSREIPIMTANGCVSINGSKANPCLSADILGDWREEVIFRTLDGYALRIYTTTIPSEHRIYTLMDDPQYRLAIAWQNVAYNQPPHPGFFLGYGMKPAPKPNIITTTEFNKARSK